ncbi:MAG: metalloregulator ArsR/SmtB family transcription factor [Bacteroidia bacterium]|nr:metalloregulator ArsR/SmtB family transcription factor [Bacteroidia bacterium]MDW8158718.1 metalloregulator ArsR/SmtB family transcription factor [Bacteroidia bacterium]
MGIPQIEANKIQRIATLLKAIAHPLRLSIIELLAQKNKLSVSELCAYLNCEQSYLSHNLNYMRLQGILDCERQGQKVYYSLRLKHITALLDCLEKCTCEKEL